MLGKILRFVIVSRFSKPLLVLLVLLVIYAVFLSPFSSSGAIGAIKYYGPAVMAFVLVFPAVSGGIAVMKSDRDYLFTLPLKRLDLAIALFIVQFMSFGLILLYMYGYMAPYLKGEFPFSIIVLISLALTATSLGPITYSLELHWRLLLGLALTAWSLSPLLGFQFSPASVFFGQMAPAAIVSVILAAVTTVLAFRSLTNVDLDVMRTLVRHSSTETKRIKSYAGMSPLKAIMVENFEVIEISGRMNMIGAGSTYRSGKFRLIWGVITTTIIAMLYFILVVKYLQSGNAHDFLLIGASYSSIIVMFMSMGVLGNERLWLGFLAVGPVSYLRRIIGAKALSFLVILLPVVVVNFILAFQGYEGTLGFGLSLLINFPSLFIIVVYISAYLSPIQIKEDVMMPSPFNLRQMVMFLPLLVIIILNAISIILVMAEVVGSVVLILIVLFLLNSRKIAISLIQKLVENGFV